MPLVTSTISEEAQRAGEGALQVVVAKDAKTLIFIFAARSTKRSGPTSHAFDTAHFSSTGLLGAPGPLGSTPSLAPPICTAGCKDDLRSIFYACSTRTHTNVESRGSCSAAFENHPSLCPGCGKAMSPTGYQPVDGQVGSQLKLVPACSASLLSGSSASLQAPAPAEGIRGDGLGELRAAQVFENPTLTALDCFPSMPIALHIVRQAAPLLSTTSVPSRQDGSSSIDGANSSSDTVGRRDITVEVWCCFLCGCAALATFVLTPSDGKREARAAHKQRPTSSHHTMPLGAQWSVGLHDCVWVTPPPAITPGHSKGERGVSMCAALPFSARDVSAPLISSYLRPLCATLRRGDWCGTGPPVRPDDVDKGAAAVEILIAWCFPGVVSLSSCPPAAQSCIAERSAAMFYVSFRPREGMTTAADVPLTAWRVFQRGIFDLSAVLQRAPRAERSAPTPSLKHSGQFAASHAGVRSLRWLPGTADLMHEYPLLAMLYAVPTIQSRSGAAVLLEPCVDTLSVCYLMPDKGTTATASLNFAPPATDGAAHSETVVTEVTGRVLVGPWSVQCLTMAHPSYLFSAALPAPLRILRTHPPAGSVSPAHTSAARRFLHAYREPPVTEILGVFQRPALEPYTISKLLRAAAATRSVSNGTAASSSAAKSCSKGEPAREHTHDSGEQNVAVVGRTQEFAFVLYSADGEVARCTMPGYVECAHTAWLETPSPEAAMQDSSSSGLITGKLRGTGVEARTVASVCAILSDRPVSTKESEAASENPAAAGAAMAVVLVVQAQWMQRAANPTADDVASSPLRRERGRHAYGVGGGTDQGGIRSGGFWRFSTSISHRLRVGSLSGVSSGLRRESSTFQGRPPLALFGNIVCWSSPPNAPQTCALLSGYATAPSGRGDGNAGYHNRHLVYEGLFEVCLLSAAIAIHDSAFKETESAPSPPISPFAVEHCCGAVPAARFARILQNMSTIDTATTSIDLLSHTPSVVSSAPLSLGSLVNDSIIPVTLAWVSEEGHCVTRRARRSLGEEEGGVLRSTQGSTAASLSATVALMKVVVLLRSGDVIGWRCENTDLSSSSATKDGYIENDGCVVHLGTIDWSRSRQSNVHAELFLENLLNSGAGVDAVCMKVVLVPWCSSGAARSRTTVPLCSSPSPVIPLADVEAAADEEAVLLVLAVRSLVGVLLLQHGTVVCVLNLGASIRNFCSFPASVHHGSPTFMSSGTHAPLPHPSFSDDGIGAGSVSLSPVHDGVEVRHLRQLPVSVPCGWMEKLSSSSAATHPTSERRSNTSIGTSIYFLWSGLGLSQYDVPLPRSTSLACVLCVTFLSWEEVLVARLGDKEVDLIDQEPEPLPLVICHVEACWHETEKEIPPRKRPDDIGAAGAAERATDDGTEGVVAATCAYVGWWSNINVASEEESKKPEESSLPISNAADMDGAKAASLIAEVTSPAYVVPVSLCDASFLLSLWPPKTVAPAQKNSLPSAGGRDIVERDTQRRWRRPRRHLHWCIQTTQPPEARTSALSPILTTFVNVSCTVERAGDRGAYSGKPLRFVRRALLSESGANAVVPGSAECNEAGQTTCSQHEDKAPQLLFATTLTLDVATSLDEQYSGGDARKERMWPVQLCTFRLPSSERGYLSDQNGDVVTYLLCNLPVTRDGSGTLNSPTVHSPRADAPVSSCGNADQKKRTAFSNTWHWIPLRTRPSSARDTATADAVGASATRMDSLNKSPSQPSGNIAVMQVLPLPRVPPRRAVPVKDSVVPSTHPLLPAAHDATLCSYFYLDSTHSRVSLSSPSTSGAGYLLKVQCERLLRLLSRLTSKAAEADSTWRAAATATGTDVEPPELVFIYESTDPDLVAVELLSAVEFLDGAGE